MREEDYLERQRLYLDQERNRLERAEAHDREFRLMQLQRAEESRAFDLRLENRRLEQLSENLARERRSHEDRAEENRLNIRLDENLREDLKRQRIEDEFRKWLSDTHERRRHEGDASIKPSEDGAQLTSRDRAEVENRKQQIEAEIRRHDQVAGENRRLELDKENKNRERLEEEFRNWMINETEIRTQLDLQARSQQEMVTRDAERIRREFEANTAARMVELQYGFDKEQEDKWHRKEQERMSRERLETEFNQWLVESSERRRQSDQFARDRMDFEAQEANRLRKDFEADTDRRIQEQMKAERENAERQAHMSESERKNRERLEDDFRQNQAEAAKIQQAAAEAAKEASGDSSLLRFGKRANEDDVSEYSKQVLREILEKARLDSATITSTTRNSVEQARIMYQDLERRGEEAVKELYGPSGDQVIDVYLALKAQNRAREEILADMKRKIEDVGPARVSSHLRDPLQVNVLDVAPSSIKDRAAFEAAVSADPRVKPFLRPPDDAAYHLVIRQPRKND